MNPDKKDNWQKRQLILALVTTALLAVVLGSLAWFQYPRKLQTLTEVHVPSLWLEGANGQNIKTVDLGEINVEGGSFNKRYVFAVASNEKNPYRLQLAHTTNIDFTYTIYAAQRVETPPSTGDYETVSGTYYQIGSPVSGKYQNQDSETKLATDVYHSTTYGSYGKVQKNAEPLYWKSDKLTFPATETSAPYISYYVLDVSWDKDVYNTKETDLIYLMVMTEGNSTE